MRFPATLLAVLVISGCTGSGGASLPTAAPSSATPRTASASPGPIEVDFRLYQNQDDGQIHFASPTGNILCDLGSESDVDFLTCYILEHVWQIPDCPSREPASLTIGIGEDEAAHVGCGGFPTDRANYRALPYGSSISGIAIVCASAQAGMTCHDERRPYGRFFASKAKYSLDVGRG